MKSRLSNGILNRLILLIFIYLFLVGCFGFLTSNFYVSYKNYQLLDMIYESDDVNEIIKNANDMGFVVTTSNAPSTLMKPEEIIEVIDGYAVVRTPTSIELIGDTVIQFTINPNIIDDFTLLLFGFVLFTTLVFIMVVFVIYFYMQKRVIIPANEIVNLISSKDSNYKFKYDDEFLIIKTELEIKNKRIQSELELKNEIMKAITHELKTPLAKISTILYLHKNQVDGYKTIEEAESIVNDIVITNEELINKTLAHFNDNIADGIVTVQEELDSLLYEYKEISLLISKTYKNDIEIKSNFLVAKFVITNIMSNAYKYADTYIEIKIDGNKIIVTNDYSKNISKKGNGLKIVYKLIESKNIELKTFYTQNTYEAVITFN